MARQRLKQRKDGRYCTRYKERFFYGYTEREAIEARDEYIRASERGSVENLACMTFSEYAMRWLPLYKIDCGKRTYEDYIRILGKASETLGDIPLKSITASHIKAAYNAVGHMSSSYIKKHSYLIRSVLESACDDGAILRNPARNVRPSKGTKGTHRALSKEEREMITDAAQRHSFGDAAMVMLYAGLRRGEMLALDIDRDVDFARKTITVRGAVWFDGNRPVIGVGKNEFTERTIPLFPPLEKQLAGKHGLVLKGTDGNHATEEIVTKRFASFIRMMECEKNGVQQKRWYGKTKEHQELIASGHQLPPWQEIHIRMHDFRHTFCMMIFDAGVGMKTAQEWMGHSDPQMIMKIYDHPSDERKQKDKTTVEKLVDNFD